jgi:DNA repair exonuclease SbcCD ATPase subunit
MQILYPQQYQKLLAECASLGNRLVHLKSVEDQLCSPAANELTTAEEALFKQNLKSLCQKHQRIAAQLKDRIGAIESSMEQQKRIKDRVQAALEHLAQIQEQFSSVMAKPIGWTQEDAQEQLKAYQVGVDDCSYIDLRSSRHILGTILYSTGCSQQAALTES